MAAAEPSNQNQQIMALCPSFSSFFFSLIYWSSIFTTNRLTGPTGGTWWSTVLVPSTRGATTVQWCHLEANFNRMLFILNPLHSSGYSALSVDDFDRENLSNRSLGFWTRRRRENGRIPAPKRKWWTIVWVDSGLARFLAAESNFTAIKRPIHLLPVDSRPPPVQSVNVPTTRHLRTFFFYSGWLTRRPFKNSFTPNFLFFLIKLTWCQLFTKLHAE